MVISHGQVWSPTNIAGSEHEHEHDEHDEHENERSEREPEEQPRNDATGPETRPPGAHEGGAPLRSEVHGSTVELLEVLEPGGGVTAA